LNGRSASRESNLILLVSKTTLPPAQSHDKAIIFGFCLWHTRCVASEQPVTRPVLLQCPDPASRKLCPTGLRQRELSRLRKENVCLSSQSIEVHSRPARRLPPAVARTLGYRCINREVLLLAASRSYGISEAKLNEVLEKDSHWWERWLQNINVKYNRGSICTSV
jgi:hypothetical protein